MFGPETATVYWKKNKNMWTKSFKCSKMILCASFYKAAFSWFKESIFCQNHKIFSYFLINQLETYSYYIVIPVTLTITDYLDRGKKLDRGKDFCLKRMGRVWCQHAIITHFSRLTLKFTKTTWLQPIMSRKLRENCDSFMYLPSRCKTAMWETIHIDTEDFP